MVIAVPAVVAGKRLDLIDLPVGFQPEGVTLGHAQTVYVTSFTGENTGPTQRQPQRRVKLGIVE